MQLRLDRSTSLIATAVLALIAGYAMLVFVPQQRALGKLTGELATLHDYVDRTGDLVPAIQTVQEELEKTNAYNAAWQEHTPSPKELAVLFGHISELSSEAGTTTTRFNPGSVVPYDRVRKIPLTIGLRGTAGQIHEFLRRLESLPQAIWIEHLAVEKGPQDEQGLRCEISLVIFADNPEISGQAKPSEKPI